jgi:uroporphyrinogen-III decarboxylase
MADIENVKRVLNREQPERIVFAPNYWQWFAHHRNHGLLPEDLSGCSDQLDMIRYLGGDVFSRNIYSNEKDYWFGGLTKTQYSDMEVDITTEHDGHDLVTRKIYHTAQGSLQETLRYVHQESTLVQEKHVIDDYSNQLDAFTDLVTAGNWTVDIEAVNNELAKLNPDEIICAGEVFSPLKMLHLAMGADTAVFFLMDHPEKAAELMAIHEKKHLDLVEQLVRAGLPAVMAMDNLDTMFHPPPYVESYSASFYKKAAQICHEHNALFFIHACGNQKDNLPLISSLGVDGLEGVAYPPMGDVELDEAMRITSDNFILTGGISANEIETLKSKEEIFNYVDNLFERMKPYAHRFILSASCNTPINTSWDTIRYFRDAWLEKGSV